MASADAPDFGDQLQHVFARQPGALALEDSRQTLTYADLDRLSSSLVGVLWQRGVRPGDFVPVLLPRSIDLVVSMVALARLGAAYVPVDLRSPPARIASILARVQPRLIITEQTEAVFDGWQGGRLSLRDLDGGLAPDADAVRSLSAGSVPAHQPLYVMFTSGSTGVPKGVVVTRANMAALLLEQDWADFSPKARWLQATSPAFDISGVEVWGALLHGATLVILEGELPSLDDIATLLMTRGITHAQLATAVFNALVDTHPEAFRSLTQFITGGERASPVHMRKVLQASPALRLINGYGPTETTVYSSTHRVSLEDTQAPSGIPIGRPIRGTQLRVDGAELLIGGAGVSLGYLGDPQQTLQRFVQHDGQRWYRTGDLVRQREDGTLEYRGRADRQVKLQSQRIELDEVELHLSACSGLGESVVLVDGDTDANRHLVVVYVCMDGWDVSPQTIRAHLAAVLPASVLPRRYEALKRMPHTVNGKIDRTAVKALVQDLSSAGLDIGVQLHEALGRHANSQALEDERGVLSYANLDSRSRLLAGMLQAHGVQAGDMVPLLLPRSVDLIVAMVALVRLGAVYVPVDLRSPPARVLMILERVQPRLVLTEHAGQVIEGWQGQQLALQGVDWSEQADPALVLAGEKYLPDQPLYVMFTSGSTGVPKGVVVTRANMAAFLIGQDWADFPVDARWLQATSPAFDISGLEIWGALLHGACLVILEGVLPSLDDIARLISTRGITHVQLATALFNAFVDTNLPALKGVRQFITGGERASPPHMRRLLLSHPTMVLINAYGPTETTVWSTSHRVTLADTHHPAGIPIGRPIRGTQVRLDDDELLIGGAGVTQGYLHDPLQTAQRFVELRGQRWYRTGDLARQRSDGVLEYRGRADRQVKLQSQRIELDEVELALASCPGVGEVAVLLRGETPEDRHLVAAYSSLTEPSPEPHVLASHVSARLPAAAVPKVFVPMARLPVNANGKVDRNALAQQLATLPGAQVPDGHENVSWSNPTEQALADIWQEVLPKARLHPQAQFLAAGGTSLLALKVSALVAQKLGRELRPVDVLLYPVLSEQAQRLLLAPHLSAPAVAVAGPDANRVPVVLTRGQRALLSATRLDPTSSTYLVHVALHVRGALDEAKWRHAFVQLAHRHPMLRLHVQAQGEQGAAWIEPELTQGWWLRHDDPMEAPRDLAWPDAVVAQLSRPMDTSGNGVMRVDLWPVLDDGTVLVWTVHHCAIDESSIDHAMEELSVLLDGRSLPPVLGSTAAMPDLELQWVDERHMADMASRLRESLGGLTAPLPRPPARGSVQHQTLPAGIDQRVVACCKAWGCTPFPVFLMAYGKALQEVFGPAFRFVSTPFSRRMDPELQEPISYWVDVAFVEAGARAGENPQDTLLRIKDETINAQVRSFEPMDLLAEMLGSDAPEVAAMLTQFGFTWRLAPVRTLALGGTQAELLRVPSWSSRYGVCLHVAQLAGGLDCSIEAVQAAQDQGHVSALWSAFTRQLETLIKLHPVKLPGPSTPSDEAAQALEDGWLGPYEEVLRQVWSEWLGAVPERVSPGSHFLNEGGTSLMLMRLSASLQRDFRLNLDLPDFLKHPTFARLCRCVRGADSSDSSAHLILLGRADAPKVYLMIPGVGGHALGLIKLGQLLQARLPDDVSVAVVDLDPLLAHGPQTSVLEFVLLRLQDMVLTLQPRQLVGVAGFSLGGLLALGLAERLQRGQDVPVCLLDTYAPRMWRQTFWRKVERRLSHWGMPPQGGVGFGELDDDLEAQEQAVEVPQRTMASTWRSLERDMSRQRFEARTTPVHLLQASQSVAYIGLIWRRKTNGFVPGHYAAWSREEMHAAHLDLPVKMVNETARAMAECLCPPPKLQSTGL